LRTCYRRPRQAHTRQAPRWRCSTGPKAGRQSCTRPVPNEAGIRAPVFLAV
jgi:hypothetical protein